MAPSFQEGNGMEGYSWNLKQSVTVRTRKQKACEQALPQKSQEEAEKIGATWGETVKVRQKSGWETGLAGWLVGFQCLVKVHHSEEHWL